MDALALGGLIAFLLRDEQQWKRARPLLYAGTALLSTALAAVVVEYHQLWAYDRWTQIIGYSAIAAIFALFVAQAALAAPGSRLYTALSQPFLLILGRHSYAIYVLHWQVASELARRWKPDELLGTNVPGRLLFAAVVGAVSFVLAWISWNLLEERCLALKRYFPIGHSDRVRTTLPADTTSSSS